MLLYDKKKKILILNMNFKLELHISKRFRMQWTFGTNFFSFRLNGDWISEATNIFGTNTAVLQLEMIELQENLS